MYRECNHKLDMVRAMLVELLALNLDLDHRIEEIQRSLLLEDGRQHYLRCKEIQHYMGGTSLS